MPNSLDVASGANPGHVEAPTLRGRMVGHLAKADSAGTEFPRRGPSTPLLHASTTTTLDLRAARVWELDDVETELRRVYDICAGCGGCLPLCPSFTVMFDRLDTEPVDESKFS